MLPGISKSVDAEKTRIMLGLLESVERGGEQSQRRLALELGVALGLVNAYLKRCINKGLVKVREAPARRYAYYLTPHGFAEKSRLTVEYLSYSFSLFRQAKKDCIAVLDTAHARGISRIAILGVSDLAEVAAICALDRGITVAAVVDPQSDLKRFVGVPVMRSCDEIGGSIDAVLVTDIKATRETIAAAIARHGADRVLIIELLGGRAAAQHGDGA
jgi:DNA-binding MarR family transcriptional regulator